ncbi:response regulator transcription factor [Methylomonas sp. AM2-LC]|uniref:response regulator transcription factor n=1 Tax=Methylomonas sp. AM2-LC TaxID=3153301 RepID=UPI003267E82E
MNILLIDDHFCSRAGVAGLLQQMFPETRVFEADDVLQGLNIARASLLNLVFLDVNLPDQDGLVGLKIFRNEFPKLSVIMFSAMDHQSMVYECLRLGAMGFITKNLSRQDFIQALLDVLSGKVYLPSSVTSAKRLNNAGLELRPVTDAETLGLTPREFLVLSLLVQGLCNKDIARLMGICEQTVKNHLRILFLKFSVTRRVELLVKLFEMGVVIGKPGSWQKNLEDQAC